MVVALIALVLSIYLYVRDEVTLAIPIILGVLLIGLTIGLISKITPGGKVSLFVNGRSEIEKACEDNDFARAYALVAKLSDKDLNSAKEYVQQKEILYLCAKGDTQSLDRIVFILTDSYPVIDDWGDAPKVKQYESQCDALINNAIAYHNYNLAKRVIPFYPHRPDIIGFGGEKGYTIKDRAKQRVIEAIKAGAFPDVGEKEIKEIKGL